MKYGKRFSDDMADDPNMGANPKYKGKKPTQFKSVTKSKDGKTIVYKLK